MKSMSRRRFLGTSAGAVGTVLAAKHARAAADAPNEKIRVGLIGGGGMGRGDLLTFLKYQDVDCPIICDVDDKMIASTVEVMNDAGRPSPQTVKDFRQVIDRKDVDAVIVGTPDHWHALPTVYACRAGKDVYCEKPLATTIGEGRIMVDAARRHQRVVQMGTQWRSAKHFNDAVAYIHSGQLGKIRQVRLWAYLAWVGSVGYKPDEPTPPGIDYDMWLGPAPKRPFNRARFHFHFRWFWDYAGGLMTDWGVHLINIAMWAMKPGYPKRVSSVGGKYVHDDMSDTPDTQFATYDFGDFVLTWEHHMSATCGLEGREHGMKFYGQRGNVTITAQDWVVEPAEKSDLEPEQHKGTGDGRPEHVRNFLDCMRSRTKPVEDVEIGQHVSTVAHLGNLALRSAGTVRWDEKAGRVVGNDAAQALVMRDYRKPWSLQD
jgi:predicted dehydrogenase